jgi:hypothetical protein
MRIRTLQCGAAITIGLALAACPIFAKDDTPGRADGTAIAAAPAPRPVKPAPQAPDADREGQRATAGAVPLPGAPDNRSAVRVAPIFRDVTDADVAEILAFVDENMPWQRPELDRLRTSNADQFRQVCRHMRYEVAQMKELKSHDPEAFRKAIEEKQLRYRAQDLANKARATADSTERAELSEELRKVIDKLFDVELATRETQISQLEGRMDALREELKTRSANRQQIVKTRLDDMLKGKKEPEHKYRPDSRSPDKSERYDKGEKSDKSDRDGDRK